MKCYLIIIKLNYNIETFHLVELMIVIKSELILRVLFHSVVLCNNIFFSKYILVILIVKPFNWSFGQSDPSNLKNSFENMSFIWYL